MSFSFRVDSLFHKDAIAVWIFNYIPSESKVTVAKPFELEFVPSPDGYRLPEPSLQMPTPTAMRMIQALLDELAKNDWIQSKTKSKGELEATKAHLDAISKVVDRLIGVIEEKL